MGKRTNKTWTTGNPQIGVRVEPSLMRLVDIVCKETEETRAEYLRRLLDEDLTKRHLKTY